KISGRNGVAPTYTQLADNQGNPLPVYLDYTPQFIQTAETAGLLPWTYEPVGDLYNKKTTSTTRDYLLAGGIQYKVSKALNLEVKYQFESQTMGQNAYQNDSSYTVRNLINSFTQFGPNGLQNPVPVGGILDVSNQSVISQQGRAQANYSNTW